VELPASTVRSFLDVYLARRKREVKPATYVEYEIRARHVIDWLGPKADRALGEISTADVLRYRDSEAARVSASTVNKGIKILRMMFEEAVRDNIIAENPAKGVRTLKISDDAKARRAFTLTEIRAILGVADEEWKSMVIFGLYTGQRLADLARLTWANVDMVNDEIRLRTGKTGRVIIIPIARPLQNHIASLPAGDDPQSPIHPRCVAHLINSSGKANTLSRQFNKILADAGLAVEQPHSKTGEGRATHRKASTISFHSLRHTATSLMKNAGMSPAVVMDIIGHESAEMSAHYTHIESDAKRKALDSMPDVTA
jgi:integrase